MSTPASRAAKRDYWNSPKAALIGRITDRALEVLAVLAFFTIASISF